MKIKWYYSRILRKIFRLPNWNVAIKQVDDSIIDFPNIVKTFQPIERNEEFWFADPILFENDGKVWLFVEAFNINRKKGEIGVFEVVDGICTNFRVVLKNTTHLSYPFVFKVDENIYMIPESGDSKTICLYKAICFPDHWKLDTILNQGFAYRDTTVFSKNQSLYALSYLRTDKRKVFHAFQSVLFSLDLNNRQLKKIYEINDKNKNLRPAGFICCNGKELILTTQKNDKIYGEAVYFWKEGAGSPSLRFTKKIGELSGKNVVIQGQGSPFSIHTYSRSSDYEVIDYKILKK